MTKPTFQDATLMLQIAQWMTAGGFMEIATWVMSDEIFADHAAFIKKYPLGSDGYNKAFNYCMVVETIGTLYKHGLFNEELLFDWLAIGATWELMKNFALGERERLKFPALWENFEFMAKAVAKR